MAAEGGSRTGASDATRHTLTPLSMFLAADIVVQSIIVVLLLASVSTWTVWIGKTFELFVSRRRTMKSLEILRRHSFLAEVQTQFAHRPGIVSRLLREAVLELQLSAAWPDKAGKRDRIASRLVDIETEVGRSMRAGTGVLATIGATAPFVGLFGTVWGIMNSFIGISASQTTNLAVVAPGIAEALLATAVGLIAAIPAVVIYNGFARSIARHRALARQCASEINRMASRELDRSASPTGNWLKQAAE